LWFNVDISPKQSHASLEVDYFGGVLRLMHNLDFLDYVALNLVPRMCFCFCSFFANKIHIPDSTPYGSFLANGSGQGRIGVEFCDAETSSARRKTDLWSGSHLDYDH